MTKRANLSSYLVRIASCITDRNFSLTCFSDVPDDSNLAPSQATSVLIVTGDLEVMTAGKGGPGWGKGTIFALAIIILAFISAIPGCSKEPFMCGH